MTREAKGMNADTMYRRERLRGSICSNGLSPLVHPIFILGICGCPRVRAPGLLLRVTAASRANHARGNNARVLRDLASYNSRTTGLPRVHHIRDEAGGLDTAGRI